MLRGNRSVYQTLFKEDKKEEDLVIPERKGRNELLIQKRNELLFSRYYYYAKMRCLKYPNVLEALSEELFLSERTIQNILMENSSQLNLIIKARHGTKFFKDKFPYLVWEQPFVPPAR